MSHAKNPFGLMEAWKQVDLFLSVPTTSQTIPQLISPPLAACPNRRSPSFLGRLKSHLQLCNFRNFVRPKIQSFTTQTQAPDSAGSPTLADRTVRRIAAAGARAEPY
eukprot:748509-Hanusia_phi.AAC.1